VKRGLTIGLAIAALGVTISLVTADSSHETTTAADAVPAYQVMTTLREMGFAPNREPVRRGPYYVLHALDRRGVEMRVVADAHFGDIISVTPARASYVVNYYRGPRIIHVPQAGEAEDSGEFDNDAVEDAPIEAAPPPPPRAKAPPRRVEPKPKQRSDAPRVPKKTASAPPPVERRTVLSAPPPPPKAMNPIYPTPRFGAQDDTHEKAKPAAEMPPPPGYEPPAAPVESSEN
jgi:hypothetical protein